MYFLPISFDLPETYILVFIYMKWNPILENQMQYLQSGL